MADITFMKYIVVFKDGKKAYFNNIEEAKSYARINAMYENKIKLYKLDARGRVEGEVRF